MPTDATSWRKVVEQVVGGLADESLQRRAWFGVGPEEDSPDEMFNQFFGDAAIEDFLRRDDTDLSEKQIQAGRCLVKLMNDLSDQTPEHIEPSELIDDPRWQRVRDAAARFLTALSTTVA